MEEIKIFYVCGGIGDFLQSFLFLSKNKDCKFIIHTHFKKAKDFFDYLGVENLEIVTFSSLQEFSLQREELFKSINIEVCPRDFFYDFPLNDLMNESNNNLKNSFSKSQPIIGFHPFGSQFANNVAKINGVATKNIDASTIYNVIDESFNYLLFGTREELDGAGFHEKENVKFVCFSNIVNSLAAVKLCSLFIGTDSCFKNMSCINGIKTYCILGAYKDDFRDTFFVNPYTQNRVLDIFHIEVNTSNQNILEYINFAQKSLIKI